MSRIEQARLRTKMTLRADDFHGSALTGAPLLAYLAERTKRSAPAPGEGGSNRASSEPFRGWAGLPVRPVRSSLPVASLGKKSGKPAISQFAPASREDSMTTATIAAAPQHMQALQQANRVRLARARLKARVASGDLSAAEVIVSCPWEAETMTISDLLLSQRRWGHTRCRRFLSTIPISENKTIGSMTERQRRTLVALLTASASGRSPAPSPSAPGFERATSALS